MGAAIPLAYEQDEDEQELPARPATRARAAGSAVPDIPLANRQSVQLAPTSGSGNLLGSTIQPGQGVDRIALAEQAWQQFADSTRPTYERELRTSRQNVAGAGQMGSGMERGAFADLANKRALQLDTERQSLINKAVADSIADQYANIAIAQQQQGFQASQVQADRTYGLQEGQLDLARETGRGNLDLARQAEERAGRTTEAQIGLATRQQNLAETLGLSNLSLAQAQQKLDEMVKTGQLSIAQAQQVLAEKESTQRFGLAERSQDFAERSADREFGLADRQQSLSETLGLGGLSLDQTRLALQQEVERGRLTLEEADQALRERSQEIQQDQFARQLAQSLEVATMGDRTQNREIDAQAALAQNEMYLRIAQMLAAMGFSPKSGSGSSGKPSGTGGGGGGSPIADNPYTPEDKELT